jgi:DNA invertase Pin-like site-specific DNA recombinase
MSGARDRRPALAELMADARRRRFRAVVVWSLDRFGRSLPQIVVNVQELASIKQAIDLSTMQGRLILYVFAMLAEIERDMIAQRVKPGLAATRARGTVLGRPPKAVDPSAVAALLAEGCSRAEMARRLRVSRRTIGRVLAITLS